MCLHRSDNSCQGSDPRPSAGKLITAHPLAPGTALEGPLHSSVGRCKACKKRGAKLASPERTDGASPQSVYMGGSPTCLPPALSGFPAFCRGGDRALPLSHWRLRPWRAACGRPRGPRRLRQRARCASRRPGMRSPQTLAHGPLAFLGAFPGPDLQKLMRVLASRSAIGPLQVLAALRGGGGRIRPPPPPPPLGRGPRVSREHRRAHLASPRPTPRWGPRPHATPQASGPAPGSGSGPCPPAHPHYLRPSACSWASQAPRRALPPLPAGSPERAPRGPRPSSQSSPSMSVSARGLGSGLRGGRGRAAAAPLPRRLPSRPPPWRGTP